MPVSIEEAKAFKQDAIEYRENWFSLATKSWAEIKKRQKDNRLWSITPNSLRRKSRYPAWYSILKIRKPIVFSRAGIPLCKDTTQDGSDPIGATAATCKERLAVNIAKTFDFFDNLSASVDDFLVTDFGQVRAFYSCKEIKEEQKILIMPQLIDPTQPPSPENMRFVTQDGKEVVGEEIMEMDGQLYLETEKVVAVKDQKVWLEPVIYKDILVDPHITKWGDCKRLLFINYYSQPQFKADFGAAALAEFKSVVEREVGADEVDKKTKTIKVYEYWDDFEKDTFWFTDYNKEFLTPTKYLVPMDDEGEEENEDLNGIYNLEKFFPCPKPMIINCASDEFWPYTEYYQIVDILEDIHTIFTRMVVCTRAIRSRMLFDSSIEGLQAALNELSESDAIGVENLAQALVSNGGNLDAAVQYVNVSPIIETLNQLYISLEQRLNTIYKLTGTADLLQGLITDPTQRTLGERQMTEKYALNQVADRQRKVQEFVRDCYELLTELALKNFTKETLANYINPASLPEDQKLNYEQAITLLKENSKRFRVELETDSTISINEEYDKQARIELVNTCTAALEKTADIAQTSPQLVKLELHLMKYLIQGFRQSKLFQAEITEAIDNVMKETEAMEQQPPPFDKDEFAAKMEQVKLKAEYDFKTAQMQSNERLEVMKMQQSAQIVSIENQLAQFKLQIEQGNASQKLQLDFTKVQADISEAQQALQIKRDELIVEMRKIADKKEIDTFSAMLEQQVASFEAQLSQAQQALAEQKMQLDMNEKYMTEARLQSEHELEKVNQQLQMMVTAKSLQPEPPKQPDITINMPPNPKTKKRTKVQRDEMGNILNFESEDIVE